MLQKFLLVGSIGAMAFIFSACGTGQSEVEVSTEGPVTTYEPISYEQENYGVDQIRIAILINEEDTAAQVVFEEFRSSLQEYLNIPVETIVGATHLVGIEAMRSGNLEMMWASPFVYLLARGALDVERLVTTDSPNVINKTVFITAQDDIKSLYDLEGRIFAFADTSSTSGFLYPMYHMINFSGYTQEQLLTGSFFSHTPLSGGQTPSMMGVLYGDFDAAAVGFIQFNNALNSGVIPADSIRIIGYTEMIPFPGYIATMELPEELRRRIQNFLLEFLNDEHSIVRWNDPDVRFELPDQAQIDHLISMVETLGIDLENAG